MTKLENLGVKFRSKNAEPFYVTMDVLFPDRATYERVKQSGVVTKQKIAELYNMPVDVVYGIYFMDNSLALKVTLYRYRNGVYVGSGDFEDPDAFGAQQHIPLTYLSLE